MFGFVSRLAASPFVAKSPLFGFVATLGPITRLAQRCWLPPKAVQKPRLLNSPQWSPPNPLTPLIHSLKPTRTVVLLPHSHFLPRPRLLVAAAMSDESSAQRVMQVKLEPCTSGPGCECCSEPLGAPSSPASPSRSASSTIPPMTSGDTSTFTEDSHSGGGTGESERKGNGRERERVAARWG